MENQDKKLISIIITCYNNESYIEQCIKSVLNGKDDKIEIILINDGSTDNSLKIINGFKNNINIISTENRGLSNARNRGINDSIGEYILFIDGDDYVEPFSINKIEKYTCDNDFDLLLLNTTKYFEETMMFEKEVLGISNEILQLSDLIDYKVCGRAWRFLYKKKLLVDNNLRFHPGVVYEDEEWVPKVIYCSNKIKYFDIDYYYYRKRKNSITSTITFNNIKDLMTIINSTYEWNMNNDWDNTYIYFSLSRCIKNVLFSLEYFNDNEKKQILNWYKENKKMIYEILNFNKDLSLALEKFDSGENIEKYKSLFSQKNKIKKIKYFND